MIPMAKSVDDDSLEMVSWPFLLPLDFVPWFQSQNVFYFPDLPFTPQEKSWKHRCNVRYVLPTKPV